MGKLIIDEDLSNDFFERSIISAYGGGTKKQVDSVTVYSNDSIQEGQEFISADINEKNRKKHVFNICRSFFSRDTLVIEFTFVAKDYFNDMILVKLFETKYNISYIGKTKKKYALIPEYLKFKNPVDKKGQLILGEVSFTFEDEDGKIAYSYDGPFKCIVE